MLNNHIANKKIDHQIKYGESLQFISDRKTAPGMTSVSVSLETRRLLNSLRSMSDFKSIDDLIEHIIKEQRMMRLQSEFEDLQKLIAGMDSADVSALIANVELPSH